MKTTQAHASAFRLVQNTVKTLSPAPKNQIAIAETVVGKVERLLRARNRLRRLLK